MKLLSAVILLGAMSTVQAAKIAVIDSGLDYKHEMIVPNLWTNQNEVFDLRDNDGNGYQDDVHGWNFGEQKAEIIDYKYLGTFSENPYKYFDIQGKMFINQATEAEIAWLRAIVADKDFQKEMGKFGNFIHGTHVAGIAIRDSKNEAMGIKLMPTEVKLVFDGLAQKSNSVMTSDKKWNLLQQGFNMLAVEQMKLLTEIARFVDGHKMEVANGSFGTGFNNIKMITDNAYRIIFFKKPSKEDSDKAAGMMINAMVAEGQKFVAAAPNTLFVFAAGNDGMSNDVYGTSPANVKADNVITVGATYNNEFFANFSNYGTKMVEVAAPGMLIDSAIPGAGQYLKVSGTSQAAPYVANVAGQIKDANKALRPVDIKAILMGTVDKKSFLSDKVTTGGVINHQRAVVAAEMSKKMTVSEAISRAKTMVKDARILKSMRKPMDVTPIPMLPLFK